MNQLRYSFLNLSSKSNCRKNIYFSIFKLIRFQFVTIFNFFPPIYYTFKHIKITFSPFQNHKITMTGYITQRNNKILFSDSPTTRFLRCHPTDLLFLPFPSLPALTKPNTSSFSIGTSFLSLILFSSFSPLLNHTPFSHYLPHYSTVFIYM